MTLNELEAQIRDYKREYGDYVGDLPVFVSGHEDAVESLALSDHSADEVEDDETDYGTSFSRAEIVG